MSHHYDIRNLVLYCEECKVSFHYHVVDGMHCIHCPTCDVFIRPVILTYGQEDQLFHIIDTLPIYDQQDEYFHSEWPTFDALDKSLYQCEWYNHTRHIIQACWISLLDRKIDTERVQFAIRYFNCAYRNFKL